MTLCGFIEILKITYVTGAAKRSQLTMKIVRNSFSCLLTLTTCAVVFYSVAKLILFLSTPVKYSVSLTWFYGLLDNKEKLKEIINVLGFDTVLIIGFILSHSLCKTKYVKEIWNKYGLSDWERSVYNLISSSTLLVSLNFNSLL